MQKTEKLPTIEDNALDGVTGGAGIGTLTTTLISNAMQISLGVAKEGLDGVSRAISAFRDFLAGK